jgi:hypothetical protein
MGYDEWLEAPYQRRCAEEEKVSRQIETYDNFDGYMQWLEIPRVGTDFEIFCLDHFWNVLSEDFKAQLHPDAVKEMTSDSPGDNWPYWAMFLFLVLDRERLEVLVTAYVNSHRDEFEQWAVN